MASVPTDSDDASDRDHGLGPDQRRENGQLVLPFATDLKQSNPQKVRQKRIAKSESMNASCEQLMIPNPNDLELEISRKSERDSGIESIFSRLGFEVVTSCQRSQLNVQNDQNIVREITQIPRGLVTGVAPNVRDQILQAITRSHRGRQLLLSPLDSTLETSILTLRHLSKSGTPAESFWVKNVPSLRLAKELNLKVVELNLWLLAVLYNELDETDLAQFLRMFDSVLLTDLHVASPNEFSVSARLIDFYGKHRSATKIIATCENILEPNLLNSFLFGDNAPALLQCSKQSQLSFYCSPGLWGNSALVTELSRIVPPLVAAGHVPLVVVRDAFLVSHLRRTLENSITSGKKVLGLANTRQQESFERLKELAKGEYCCCIIPSGQEVGVEWPCDTLIFAGIPNRAALIPWTVAQQKWNTIAIIPDLSRPEDMYFSTFPQELLQLEPAVVFNSTEPLRDQFKLFVNGKQMARVSAGEVTRKYFEGSVFFRGERLTVTRLDESARIITAQSAPLYERETVPFEKLHIAILSNEKPPKKTAIGTLHFGKIRVTASISMYRERKKKTEVICQLSNCDQETPKGKHCAVCRGSLAIETYDIAPATKPTKPTEVIYEDYAVWISPLQASSSDPWERAHTLEHALRLATAVTFGFSTRWLTGHSDETGTCFIWDNTDSQAGQCSWIFSYFPELLSRLSKILDSCNCQSDEGCTSCLQSPYCEWGGVGVSKALLQEFANSASTMIIDESPMQEIDTERCSLDRNYESSLFDKLSQRIDETLSGLVTTGEHADTITNDFEPIQQINSDSDYSSDTAAEILTESIEIEPTAWWQFSDTESSGYDDSGSAIVRPYNEGLNNFSTQFGDPFARNDSERALDLIKKKYPLLQWKDQLKLFYLARSGDKTARDQLILHNIRLTFKYSNDRGPCCEFVDLVQEGVIGLMRAIELFDPAKGNRFTTYAIHWIRQAITRHIANHGRSVRLPVHIIERLYQFARASRRLESELGRAPTDKEIAVDLQLPFEKVAEHRRLYQYYKIASLSELVADLESELEELIPDREENEPEFRADAEDLRDYVDTMLSSLHPREKAVLEMRFGLKSGESMTLEQIGNVLGLTRERIRQLEYRALKRLRNKYKPFANDIGVRIVPDKKESKAISKREKERKKTAHPINTYIEQDTQDDTSSVREAFQWLTKPSVPSQITTNQTNKAAEPTETIICRCILQQLQQDVRAFDEDLCCRARDCIVLDSRSKDDAPSMVLMRKVLNDVLMNHFAYRDDSSQEILLTSRGRRWLDLDRNQRK